jgi:hypothetical protein
MKLIHTISLGVMIAGCSHGLWAAEVACMDAMEHQKISETYADLSAKYDLQTISQEFLDLFNATRDLKEQVNSCKRSVNEHDPKYCDVLAQQYKTKRMEQEALVRRLYVTIDMQQYLLTLKLRLERPICGK